MRSTRGMRTRGALRTSILYLQVASGAVPCAYPGAPGCSATCHSATSQRTPWVTCSHESVAPAMFLMSALARSA